MTTVLRVVTTTALVSVLVVTARPALATAQEKTTKINGITVHYRVVLPDGYDPARTYPAILAFGGGPQTMNTVDGVLTRNLQAEAEKRGYLVIAPAAPEGELFFEGGDRILPSS